MNPEQYVVETGNHKHIEFEKSNTNYEVKKGVIEQEMLRMNRLPPNSSYASHRLRVLNKILNLLSLQRSTSQEEELELLFAGLNI